MQALEVRLIDLARGFEEATIDKNQQEEKAQRMDKMLDTAAALKRVTTQTSNIGKGIRTS